MQINRHTYEEFFVSYIDNELDAEGRQAVEAFALDNPDLAKELHLLQQARIHPEQGIIFLDKKSLFKSEEENTFFNGLIINPGNYEEYFTLYIDNELSAEEKKAVDDFVHAYPQYLGELGLFVSLKVEPDLGVHFAGKERLYREEERRRFITWGWQKMAAAALVGILLSVSAWFYFTHTRRDTGNGQTLSGNNRNGQSTTPGAPLKEKTTSPSADKPGNKVAQSVKTDTLLQQEMAIHKEEAIPQRRQAKEKPSSAQAIAATDKTKKPSTAEVLAKAGKSPRSRARENAEAFIQPKSPGVTPKDKQPETAAALIPGAVKQQKIDTRLLTAAALNHSVKMASVLKPAATVAALKNKPEQKEMSAEETNISDDSRTYATESSSSSENALFYVANTSVSRKNRFRGFFRKATRIIEKTAHIEPSAGRESIRIANLEIALQ
ncbi:MAG: hypothetical protein ABI687_06675 [Flavitalea sp.]